MSLGSNHADFARWAEQQGVVTNGVTAAQLPGKGIGIVATKKLKRGEVLVTIPSSSFITLDSPFAQSVKIKDCTVHGTIATALAVNCDNNDRPYKLWEAVWPTMGDLQSMPINWPQEFQARLPPAAIALLRNQEQKFDRDWQIVHAHNPDLSYSQFKYYWLITNTRCFYWEFFKLARQAVRKGKRLPRDDCMALCPFADYFNHADEGCSFEYNFKGGSIVCNREYRPGEEVVVSYGSHSNDYLLIEYGFILSENRHDNTKVDHLILSKLSEAQSALLQENGYFGDYTLDANGVCYRTQVAIRTMLKSREKMSKCLLEGHEDEKDQAKVDARCSGILLHFRTEGRQILVDLERLGSSVPTMLITRWGQILEMVESSL